MATLKSINPYTKELNWEFETLNIEEINKKIEIAHKAYWKWKKTPNSEKKELFLKLADTLEKDIDECAKLQTIEMWMLFSESKWWLFWTVNLIKWFANNFEEILAEKDFESEWFKVKQVYDPLWVIFWIAPWNLPFNQLLRAAVPNILAWNTQVYKHSSNVPMTALKIQELFDKAGFPEWVYTNLFVSSSLSEEILSNKFIAWVNLTWSERAWQTIWSLAWKYIKPSVLELWWNDSFLALENSDMDQIIDFAVKWRMRNWWETCNSSKRFLIHEKNYDEFVKKYSEKISELKHWDPMDENTQVQPLASEKAVNEIEKQVQRAVESWAKIETWWEKIEWQWFFFKPTVLSNVTKETSSFHEEIFWPVASVTKYSTTEEAIELANWIDLWLSAVVIWNDEKEAIEVWKQLEWWMIFINQNAASKASLPMWWVKKSWYWKENWPDWLKAFTNNKVIIL